MKNLSVEKSRDASQHDPRSVHPSICQLRQLEIESREQCVFQLARGGSILHSLSAEVSGSKVLKIAIIATAVTFLVFVVAVAVLGCP